MEWERGRDEWGGRVTRLKFGYPVSKMGEEGNINLDDLDKLWASHCK